MDRLRMVGRYIAGIPLAYYGYALQKTWSSIDIGDIPHGVILEGGFSEMVGGLLFLTLIPLSMKLRFTQRRKILFPLGLAMQIASAFLAVAVEVLGLTSTSVLMFNVIFKAVGLVVMSALWIEAYASFNPLRAVFLLATSTLFTALILFIVDNDHGMRLLAVRLVLPLFAAYCYWIAFRDGFEGKDPATRTGRAYFPHKAVIFVAVCSFAYGSTLSSMGPGLTNYVAAVPAAVVMVAAVFYTRRFGVAIMGYLVTLLMVCGYLMTILLPGVMDFGAAVVLDMGYGAMGTMVLLIVCTVSYATGASAIWLFGILTSTQFICYHIGFWFSRFIPARSQSMESMILGIVVVAALITCSLVLMSEKSLSSSWGASGDKGRRGGTALARADALRERYGLTVREGEVLVFILEDCSIAAIANEMVVSESTVKSHLHNIYTKFGVHSRGELQRLIEGARGDGADKRPAGGPGKAMKRD